MGRWSRAVAPDFLTWLAAPRRARWLDVGCGTGILTEALLSMCAPAAVDAVDAASAQVNAAAEGHAAGRATFQVADATKLPFPPASFDAVASALVINFISDRSLALAEMRRVACPGGRVAAYVWDFAEERSPSGPLRRALRRVGIEAPPIPGTDASRVEALSAAFLDAGFVQVETRTIEVCLAYTNFEDFWQAQTPRYAPTTQIIAAMTAGERRRLIRAVQAVLPAGPNGSVEYCARANAIKARVMR